MSEGTLYLGVDIGGTKCACVVGDAGGAVVERVGWPSNAERGPEAMIEDVLRQAQDLGAKHAIAGVGVAIGGPLDCRNGVVLSPPNLPGWDAVPLKARLEEALSLPVTVEHDAAACALAEHRWGIGRAIGEATTLVYLTCGTGFGMGLVIDGRVYHGAGGRSPEIGHVTLAEDGPVAFGKQGSVEAFCAGSSLARLAKWRFPVRWPGVGPEGAVLARLAAAGDIDALSVIDLHAQSTGRVCAAIADALFPDAIVLGSLARYLGDGWLRRVRERFVLEALPDAAKLCRLEPATLGERLQDLSALVVAVAAG